MKKILIFLSIILLYSTGYSQVINRFTDSTRQSGTWVYTKAPTNGYVLHCRANGTAYWAPDSTGGGGSTRSIHSVVTNLTSHQILFSHDTPIVSIVAPGSGKYIQINSFSWAYTFNTSAYVVPSNFGFVIGDTNTVINIDIAESQNTYLPIQSSSNEQNITFVNKPVYLFSQGINPTSGDGTLKVILTYYIIDAVTGLIEYY